MTALKDAIVCADYEEKQEGRNAGMGYHRSMTDHLPPWPTPAMAAILRVETRLNRMLVVLGTVFALLYTAMGLILLTYTPPLP